MRCFSKKPYDFSQMVIHACKGSKIENWKIMNSDSVNFTNSEKVTKVCKISTVDLTINYIGQIYGAGDFKKNGWTLLMLDDPKSTVTQIEWVTKICVSQSVRSPNIIEQKAPWLIFFSFKLGL